MIVIYFLNLLRGIKEYATLVTFLSVRKIVMFSKYRYRKKIDRLFSPTQLLIQGQ